MQYIPKLKSNSKNVGCCFDCDNDGTINKESALATWNYIKSRGYNPILLNINIGFFLHFSWILPFQKINIFKSDQLLSDVVDTCKFIVGHNSSTLFSKIKNITDTKCINLSSKNFELPLLTEPIKMESKVSTTYNKLQFDILRRTKNKKNVIFGPIVGEFGWEIIVWSGFIRRFKLDNPSVNVIVVTRENRKSLYEDIVDEVVGFEINGDYKTFTPRTNTLMLLENNRKRKVGTNDIIEGKVQALKEKYPDAEQICFNNVPHSQIPPLPLCESYYEYNGTEKDKTVVQTIIDEYKDKKIVVVFSRHRRDLTERNWAENNWTILYDRLKYESQYLFIISGVSPSYVRPESQDNVIVLEDIESVNPEASVLGMSIEFVKKAVATFGTESAGMHLSRSMRVPAIFIGEDKPTSMSYHIWNPYKTKSVAIAPDNITPNIHEYVISVNKVMNHLRQFLSSLNNNHIHTSKIEVVDTYKPGSTFISKADLLKSKKICSYLNNIKNDPSSNVLFIFDHGFGDMIMFLHLYETIKEKYPNINFKIGANKAFGLEELHSDIIPLNTQYAFDWVMSYYAKCDKRYSIGSICKGYDFVFEIGFHEAQNKMKTCAYREFGFTDPIDMNLYHMNVNAIPFNDTNTIGIHAVSNSGTKMRSLNTRELRTLWHIVFKLGYNPVLFHTNYKVMNPEAKSLVTLDWIPEANRINPKSNLTDVANKISTCKYFIGVPSGPITMAQQILGDNRCINLNKTGKTLNFFLGYSKIKDVWPIDERQIVNTIHTLNKLNS